jgi:DNA-binding Xre family transcriptional regulator
MITYKRLWERLNKTGVSQYRLRLEGLSNSTITRLKHDETVSTETINKLCKILACNVEDIMEYVED